MKTVKTKNSLGRIVATVAVCIVSLAGFLGFFAAICYKDIYGDTGFDSVLYTLFGGLSGMQPELLAKFFFRAILPAVLCTVVVALLLFLPKRAKWMPSPALTRILSLCLSFLLLTHAAFNVGLVQYVHAQLQLTLFYEYNYVDPDTVKITFPEEKRNLIYIYLESMETSFLHTSEGGAMENNLIPELTQLALDHVSFSHNDYVGGLVEVPGASWTVGSMVAQTSGVPLITPTDVDDWQNGYGKEGEFLPGLTTLNNILHDAGYYQALMVGSDADFGGRKTYFDTHDMDKIYDIFTAREDGIVPEDYFVWWGMEDLHLYEYAKQELTKISQQEQPFAFTMLTVDTHHVGGYPCAYCTRTYDENYENVISCASRQVAAFVEWIQQQDFYENTTVIITGDHFSMDSGFFERNVPEDYARHGYNCFINAAAEVKSATLQRQFSALDMFPTTLAAMGCTIEGNRLGFGVNLFEGTPTLIEEYGYETVCEELSKRTNYYSLHFY